MAVALMIFLVIGVALVLFGVVVFHDKELISKTELKEIKQEYKIMDQAMREAFINPDQAQLYISNAFTQIQTIKSKEIQS